LPPQKGSTTGAPLRTALSSQKTAGALGKGLQFANAFVLLFKFLAYTIPIFGAWLGDTKIGRFPAILLGVLICGVAHLIQIVGALPSVLVKHQGLAPFLISLLLLAFGAGIFKPNILPTVLDQYTQQRAYVKTLNSGERVIVDPEMTINRISLYFYGFVNVGAFLSIATVYAEKHVGFWLAFLIPGKYYSAVSIRGRLRWLTNHKRHHLLRSPARPPLHPQEDNPLPTTIQRTTLLLPDPQSSA
jgi:dipeptide/tripeptide permease